MGCWRWGSLLLLRRRRPRFRSLVRGGGATDGGVGAAGRRWCRGGVEGGGATVVSGRRWGGGATVASRAAGRRWCRGGATVASGEEIGEGDRGRGRGRERGSIRSRGGTILMAHHPSVRHKYIHANGAPHPGAPLVFFLLLPEPTGYLPPDLIHIKSSLLARLVSS